MTAQNEWHWSVKVKLNLWCLYKISVSLGFYLTCLASNMIFAWTVLEKWQFQEFSSIIVLGIKFSHNITSQGQLRFTQIHHLCKPGRVYIHSATYQIPRPLTFWLQSRSYLKGFTICGGHAIIQICYKFTFYPPPPHTHTHMLKKF